MLQRLKLALLCAFLAAAAGVAVQAILLLNAATRAAAALPRAVSTEIQATRTALVGEVASTRKDLTGQIESARKDILVRTERQVAALRVDTIAEVDQIRQTADRRMSDSLARVDAALGKIDDVRGDLRPVLTNVALTAGNAASLTKDAQDSWDDLYWDVKATVGSVDVAATSFGQMSEQAKVFFPQAQQTWLGIGRNVDGITGNIKKLTTPRWYDRVLGYGLSAGSMYRDLNPGYNAAQGIRGLFTKHKEQ